MQKHDEFLENLNRRLPETCRTKDLINAGIYGSEQAAAAARRRGNCPAYFKLNERVIMYSKGDVIAYLQSKRHATENMVCLAPVRKSFQTQVKVVPHNYPS